MADYREMYFELLRATERAMNTLIEAQQRAEEMFLAADEPKLTVVAARYVYGEREAEKCKKSDSESR